MFDIGFWELLTIFVIGVVVIGPQKLPEVVREIFAFLGRIRRMYENAKDDISRELELDKLKKAAQEADMTEHIKKINHSIMEAEQSGKDLLRQVRGDLENSSEPKELNTEPSEEKVVDASEEEAEEDVINDEISNPENDWFNAEKKDKNE